MADGESRKEQAKHKILENILDAGAIVIGTAALFLSGGTATPVVIAAGGSKLFYDGSNVIEGVNSLELANAGDIYTVACNPVCDTLFIGKETTDEEVAAAMEEFNSVLAKGKDIAFVIKCSIGARDDLGRPTTTALENKQNFMEYLSKI